MTHPTHPMPRASTAVARRAFRLAALAIAGAAFITLCARVQVPMWPVPMTMQTFAILLLSLAYGPRLAVGTVALYLAAGSAGLPVFASGGGIAYLLGPTGGYLLGSLAVAGVVGHVASHDGGRSLDRALAAALLGTVLFYLAGASWLASYVGPGQALALGVLPFVAGDVLKALLAVASLPAARFILSRIA